MIRMVILGVLLFASGLVVGFLFGLRFCDNCEEKEKEIAALISEVHKYKRLVDKVANAYRQKHPEV